MSKEGMRSREIVIIAGGRHVGKSHQARLIAAVEKAISEGRDTVTLDSLGDYHHGMAETEADKLREEAEKLVERMAPPVPEHIEPPFFRREHTHPNSPWKRGGR